MKRRRKSRSARVKVSPALMNKIAKLAYDELCLRGITSTHPPPPPPRVVQLKVNANDALKLAHATGRKMASRKRRSKRK